MVVVPSTFKPAFISAAPVAVKAAVCVASALRTPRVDIPVTPNAPDAVTSDPENVPPTKASAVAVVNVPAAASLAPITDPSIEELSMSPPSTVKLSATMVSVTSLASTTWLVKSV